MNDLETYLDILFDGLDGYVYSPVKTENSFDPNWFKYPAQKDELVYHVQSGGGEVYISPAVYSEKRATKDAVKKVQTVWVEFDGATEIDFSGRKVPEPTLIVQTSLSTHCHCYWRIPASSGPTVENINRRLTYHLQADSSGWDSTQLLRPPGTFNFKRGMPVELRHASNEAFTIEVFDFVPKITLPPNQEIEIGALLKVEDILANHSLPGKVLRMVRKEAPGEPYRSSFLTRLANELAEESLTHLEIVSLLKHADERIQKFALRTDQMSRLSQLADYAIHKHSAESAIIVYNAEQILKYVDDLQWVLPNLLSTTGQMLIASAPGVGKTQLALQLMYLLERQQKWVGYQASELHKPLLLSLEMDVRSVKYIISHQKKEWGDFMPQLNMIDERANLAAYEDIIDELQPTVVIIDSLTELFDDASESANAEARRAMLWCRKIRRRYGVAIILIHHTRKATEGNKKPKSIHDITGSFQFGKDSDTAIVLWEERNGDIEFGIVKARFGPKGSFLMERNENLWFVRKNATDEQRAIPADTGGNSEGENLSFRHGDDMVGETRPRIPTQTFRTRNNDFTK